MDYVTKYLENLIEINDTIIVACSGGPDSMCLLSLLVNFSKKVRIICAHVNHNVREESKEEYFYVKQYCEKNNIIFEGITIEKYNNENFENEARNYRYSFFESLKNKYNAKYIMTAHHGDDLIETILMRISRGSTLSGYAGIKIKDNYYVRPLLMTTKKVILEYLELNNIKYYNDKTNDEDIHTRNRYRHYVLPFLKKENANIHKKYFDFSKELLEYDDFVNSYIEKIDTIKSTHIDLKALNQETNFIKRKVIEKYIKTIQESNLLEVSNKTVKDILDMIESKKPNIFINLNNEFVAKKSYDRLSIEKKSEPLCINELFNDYYEDDNFIIKIVKESNEKSNNVIRLLKTELIMPLYLRSRQNADKMVVKNLGTKKIKDIIIDEKINVEERNHLILLVDNANNIIWMPGIKKSKFDKEKNENYDIIISCERKTNNDKCKKE